MSKPILLECPKCGRKFGIADASGTIHVTCPSCGKQWDWGKRRAPALGTKWRVARDSSAPFLGRAAFFFGAFLFRSRFSGLQVIVALTAGVGIGVMVGDKMAVRKMANEPEPVTVSLPTSSGSNYLGPSNVLDLQGSSQKSDETFPTNLPSLEPPKSKR